MKHPNEKNNGGTHCCAKCKKEGINMHGGACKQVLLKCRRPRCHFTRHPDGKNNDGTHCCARCKKDALKHGKLCKKVKYKFKYPKKGPHGKGPHHHGPPPEERKEPEKEFKHKFARWAHVKGHSYKGHDVTQLKCTIEFAKERCQMIGYSGFAYRHKDGTAFIKKEDHRIDKSKVHPDGGMALFIMHPVKFDRHEDCDLTGKGDVEAINGMNGVYAAKKHCVAKGYTGFAWIKHSKTAAFKKFGHKVHKKDANHKKGVDLFLVEDKW